MSNKLRTTLFGALLLIILSVSISMVSVTSVVASTGSKLYSTSTLSRSAGTSLLSWPKAKPDYWTAYRQGYRDGYADGRKACHNFYGGRRENQSNKGYADGYNAGHTAACAQNSKPDYWTAYRQGYQDGYADGRKACHNFYGGRRENQSNKGYADGYNAGHMAACAS